jgi:hypothetical protein
MVAKIAHMTMLDFLPVVVVAAVVAVAAATRQGYF